MKAVQRLALASEIVRGLPPLAPSGARAAFGLILEEPEESLAQFRARLMPSLATTIESRYRALLDVQAKMEAWQASGGNTVFFDDPGYPWNIANALMERSPLVLFTFGDIRLLQHRSVGVVGSRDATDSSLAFARALGAESARLAYSVVSGGARGVDTEAMRATLATGGSAIIYTPQLDRTIEELRAFTGICLASPFAPDAGFSAGNAMSRNKLIYASAEVTIVVESATGTGGTWAGAKEALSRGYGRVAAWSKSGPGCEAILAMGAARIDEPNELRNLIQMRGNSSQLF